MESERYYKLSNDKKRLGSVQSDIGGVYYQTSKFEKALEFLEQAGKIAQELNDSFEIANNFLNRGLCYMMLGKTNEALEVFGESERILKLIHNYHLLTNIYMGMGELYRKTNELEKAEYYGLLAIEFSQKTGNQFHLVYSRASLLETYTLSKAFDKGNPIVEQLLTDVTTTDALPLKKGVYEILIRFSEAKSDYQSAYQYLKINQQLTDSLYAQEREKEQKRLETVAKLKEKEAETLQKDTVINQQRTTMYIVVFALLFIGTLLYLQFLGNKKLKKTTLLLEQQQAEVSARKKELEQLNATKDRLFSIISHDLMSPIATLSSLLELLKYGEIRAEAMPMFLDEALTEVGNTSVFLKNLLLWAKSQMGGFVIKQEVIAPNELIQNNINLMQPQIRKKKLQIVTDLGDNLKAFVDEDLLQTVFRNLLANAIKFSPERGIINITVQQQNNMLQIAIKDNGVGIPKEVQPKILTDEIYSTYGTQNEKGTGLGLILCREFVTKMTGEIWFKSEEGKGTSFYFTLPAA